MGDENNPWFDPAQDVITPAAALQGLAHPLRLRLLGALRWQGPSTATRLAQTLAISSGLASYHLRQLAAAGFIVPADPSDLTAVERGGARERWWKAARRSTHVVSPPPGDEEAAAVTAEFLAAVLEVYFGNARSWLDVAHTWPQRWQDASDFSDLTLRLTPAQAKQLQYDLSAVIAQYPRADASTQALPDSAAMAIQYQLFPRADQTPPEEDE